jgi:nitrogen regulatory protein PII
MKMVMLVFRNSMEEDVFRLLNALGVDAFTAVPRVRGAGEAGTAFDSFESPGSNSLVFAVLEDERVEPVVRGLRRFHDEAERRQRGANIPLRAFVLPCVDAV